MTANAPAGEEPQQGSNPLELALVAVLALACLLTPFLWSSPSGEGASVGNELVFDGRELITGHEVLSNIPSGQSGLFDTLTTTWWGELQPTSTIYRPLSSFVLGLGATVAGEPYDPASPGSTAIPYKLFSLSLKLICALLVVELGALLLGSRRHGFIAGLLFATLPVHGDAIFDVAGTANLLAAALSLGAWTAWLKAGDKPLSNPGALVGSLLLTLLATLAHEAAYALPLVFFLGDLGRAKDGGIADGVGHALSKLPALLGAALAVGASLALKLAVTGDLGLGTTTMTPATNPLADAGLVGRLLGGLALIGSSLPTVFGLSPFSSNFTFSPDYSAAQVGSGFGLGAIVGLGVLLVAGLGAVALFTKCRTRASLLLCFFGSLVVAGNLLFAGEVAFAERLLVFPSAIAVLFVAPFLVKLGSIAPIAALVLAVANGGWTYLRADDWGSNTSLWTAATKGAASQGSRAHFFHGVSLAREQLFPLAATSYAEAVELAPDFDLARVQHAAALMSNFRTEEALAALRATVENRIDASDGSYVADPVAGPLNVDLLLYQITQTDAMDANGDPERHLAWLSGLIEGGYDSPYAHLYRADTLGRLPQTEEETEEAYRRSLEIVETPAAVRSYGRFLRRRGRSDEALALYKDVAPRLASQSTSDNDRAALNEFKLLEADLEYLNDAQRASTLVAEVLAEGELTAEQRARALILRAQTRLDLTPASGDPIEVAAAQADSSRDLQAALGMYQVKNEQTKQALYIVADLLRVQGRLDVAEQAMLEIVSTDRAAVLHGYLAQFFARSGRLAEAADQFELSTSGLLGPDGAPIDDGIFTTMRMKQLLNLDALGGQDAAIAAILTAEGARADSAGAVIEAHWGAATEDWSMMERGIAAMRERISDASVEATIQQLEYFRQVCGDLAANSLNADALTFQAERALELINLPRARAAIQRALELTPDSETDAKAYRLSVLARVLEADYDPVAALERLREAAELPGISADGSAMLGSAVARLEALLTP